MASELIGDAVGSSSELTREVDTGILPEKETSVTADTLPRTEEDPSEDNYGTVIDERDSVESLGGMSLTLKSGLFGNETSIFGRYEDRVFTRKKKWQENLRRNRPVTITPITVSEEAKKVTERLYSRGKVLLRIRYLTVFNDLKIFFANTESLNSKFVLLKMFCTYMYEVFRTGF